MAQKLEKWQSDDGHEYKTELEAIKADSKYWKERYLSIKLIKSADEEYSSYGSSGGGGHD